jgi:hypothetical protein
MIARQNIINESRSTAIYLGCQDGVACIASELLLEDNFINRVSANAREMAHSHVTHGISAPLEDYFGKVRGSPAVIGAVEPPGSHIIVEFKRQSSL